MESVVSGTYDHTELGLNMHRIWTGYLKTNIVFVWDFPTLCQHRRYLFIYLYTRTRCCHVVSISKREDAGNETLGMSVAVWRLLHVLGVVSRQLANYFDLFSRCDYLQGKGKSSSLLTFFHCIQRVVPAILQGLYSHISS